MSGSTSAFKAIFERLCEVAEKKAQAQGKSIYKLPSKPHRVKGKFACRPKKKSDLN